MSLRREQYWALKKTRQFLSDMLFPQTRPKTIKELKQRVFSCTRHFPSLDEHGRPYFSKDEWGPDEPPRE